MTMQISNFSFGRNYAVENAIKTITDPTDVNNKDAAIGGTAAAAGVTGAAAIAGKFRALRKTTSVTQSFTQKAIQTNKNNISILTKFAKNLKSLLNRSKFTSKIVKIAEIPAIKKLGGGFLGVIALIITVAQLFSAADMAAEAWHHYKN